jgi:hypothetical protein
LLRSLMLFTISHDAPHTERAASLSLAHARDRGFQTDISDNLVHEAGVTGHKIGTDDEPASRNTWRDFSLALRPLSVFTELLRPTCAPLRLSAISPLGRIR